MTREEWLIKACEKIDLKIFNGDLDILNHGFQIACGMCPGKKKTHTIQPYEGEDVKMEDFFPTTISVSHTLKNPKEILGHLAYECVFAFFNEKKLNKKTKHLLAKYYFEEPYNSYHPSEELEQKINEIYQEMVKSYGDFPGIPVIPHQSKNNNHNKNTLTIFCPVCGYQIKVSKAMHKKHGGALPTCVCGAKMGIDLDEDENQNK